MKRLLLLLCLLGVALDGKKISRRQVNGSPATHGQFPFIVSIRNFRIHWCGGSIIHKKWVLTASHCNITTSNFTILAGTVSQKIGGDEYNISKVIDHEDFNYTYVRNDIALLLISREFKFNDFVKPVKIKSADENEMYITAGWGILDSKTKQYPIILQYVNVGMVSLRQCQEIYRKNETTKYLIPSNKQVCTFASNGAGPCDRDSGGPLITTSGHLVGILSHGPTQPCGKILPDVFTKTSSYIQWIKQHIPDFE